jgi:MerC mercury resistance protein
MIGIDMALKSSHLLDLTSMGLSGLCLIHCLALPLLIAALPALGGLFASDSVHKFLVFLVVPLTLYTFYRAKSWVRLSVILPGLSGLSALSFAAYYPPFHDYELVLTVLGAILVAIAHLMNVLTHAYAHRHKVKHDCHIHKT